SHRRGTARRVDEMEPEQDALAARAVDLAPLERGPDAVAIASRAGPGHQAAGQEERRLALEIEDLEVLHALGRVRRIERDRLSRGRRGPRQQAHAPGLVAWTCRRAHDAV